MTVCRQVTSLAAAGIVIGGCFLIVRCTVPSSNDGVASDSQLKVDDSQHGGLEWFQSKEGKYGLRNGHGDVVLEPKYDGADPFSEGLAAVNLGGTPFHSRRNLPTLTLGGKWGYVNSVGKLVIPIQYKCVGRFREGLAPAYTIPENLDCRTRFIDWKGKIQFTVTGLAEEFHEGLAMVAVNGHEPDRLLNRSYGFIDKQGHFVIGPKFGQADSFSEGLAAVWTKKATVDGTGGSWGFIDKTGNYVIQPAYNEVGSFNGGVARAHVGGVRPLCFGAPCSWDGGQWWLIDKAGNKLQKLEH